MTLMRVISKVDNEGKIKLPGNIQRAAGLKKGQMVEMRIVGGISRTKDILLSARSHAG